MLAYNKFICLLSDFAVVGDCHRYGFKPKVYIYKWRRSLYRSFRTPKTLDWKYLYHQNYYPIHQKM